MRCGTCGNPIEREEDVSWIRGTAVCLACANKSRAGQRIFFAVWLVMAFLMLVFVLSLGTVIVSGLFKMK